MKYVVGHFSIRNVQKVERQRNNGRKLSEKRYRIAWVTVVSSSQTFVVFNHLQIAQYLNSQPTNFRSDTKIHTNVTVAQKRLARCT